MRAAAMLVPADQAGQATLDADTALVVALRLVSGIRRVEADRAALATVSLERRFLIVDERDDDLAIARCVDLADESEVTVENAFFDHRVTRHFQRIMLAGPEQRGRNRK